MRIPDPPIHPARIARFVEEGYWVETTSNDALGRSASARNGRCGESGLTLMAVALFHGSMLKSRAAATSAPAKFGIRPCGGNGKRASPSATSLSQTHCRAAFLSAKSRAMTEIGAARPGDSQGAICLMKNLGRDPRLADVSLVDREAQAPMRSRLRYARSRAPGSSTSRGATSA